jgi:hypothetical protein
LRKKFRSEKADMRKQIALLEQENQMLKIRLEEANTRE